MHYDWIPDGYQLTIDVEVKTLIFSDIFKEGILYQEITRDFSRTAEPMSAIISIEMIDSENIMLKYYKGEEFAIIHIDIIDSHNHVRLWAEREAGLCHAIACAILHLADK